ncbi:MAG: serine protease [Lentisphaerae bacterium]|nr:serine protease [Lentisphaerota bacterium]
MNRRFPFLVAVALAAVAACTALGPAARADAPGAAATNAATAAAAAAGDRVLVIPVRGAIEPALLYIIRRGAQEAADGGARAVVFVIDTPGGRLDAADAIMRTLQGIRAPTYAFVEKNAFSAGALIAMATRTIYMAPGSVIGDAMPILALPIAGPQEMPADLKEKTVSATAALARAAAEQAGHNPEVAEAMIRAEMELKIGGEVIKPAGRLLTLTNEEALRPVGPAKKPLLSAGTVASVEELLKAEGIASPRIEELRVTGAERIARWIQMLGWLFLIAGAAGIYIEVKTPGFGLPGILGLCSLAIFFWGHHVAGLAGHEDLALIAIGLVLLAVEIFIPGFGIPGMVGTVLLAAGLLLAMAERPPGGGWLPTADALRMPLLNFALAIAGTVALGAVLSRWLPRTGLYHDLVLETSTSGDAGYVASGSAADLAGADGRTATDLRPAGTAILAGRRVDVVSSGGFIARGTPVRVIRTEGARVVVEPRTDREGGAPA